MKRTHFNSNQNESDKINSISENPTKINASFELPVV